MLRTDLESTFFRFTIIRLRLKWIGFGVPVLYLQELLLDIR
ncbi:MAG: hypothetical protein Q8O37_08445 [Sulfuricellaceae bacterium]|nr:hypothetical protein [Sulfuricellaceae bacterium]